MLSSIALVASLALASAQSEGTKLTGYSKSVLGTDFLPNKCRYDNLWGNTVSVAESRFAYVLQPEWQNASICGQCAKVRATGSSSDFPTREVTVLITSYDNNELCPTADPRCKSGSLLLSRQAFRDMFNGVTPSSTPIEWELVRCPSQFVNGNIEFFFHPGTSKGFISVQPRNFARPISKLEAVLPDGTVKEFSEPGEIIQYGSYRTIIPANENEFAHGFSLRAYAKDTNEVIVTSIDQLPKGSSTVEADGQFQ